QLNLAASSLKEEVDDGAEDRPVRGWRKRETVSVPEFLRGVWDDLRRNIESELGLRCQELRAVEMALADIAAEFGAEDTHPLLQASVEATKEQALRLSERLSGRRRRRLPEPSEKILGLVRGLVDRSFEALGLVKGT